MSKTPKLRFKEFSGDWECKCLEDLFSFKNGLNKEKEFFGKGTPIVNFTDVYKNRGLRSEDIKGLVEVNEKELLNYNVTKGDVFFTRTSETIDDIGMSSVILDEVENTVFSGFVLRARPKNDILSDGFKKYCFSTFNARKEIVTKSSFTTRALTSGTLLNGVEINYPSKEEQEKIASFFSLIDDKISLQGQKVESLKDYKRGMMQKIFGRELRFKDDEGRDYPDWEVTTIEKVADLEKGFTPDTKNEKNWGGDTPWLSIADMKQGKYISDVSKHISYEALGNKKLVPKGTLIMSFKLTLGRLGIINTEMMTNEAICHFYWKNKNINTEYMYYYLSTVNIESFGCRAAKGITLNNDSLNSIVVKLPVIEEQNKIADILMKIDNKIYKEQEKLDSLNEYKKGLLQQMFI